MRTAENKACVQVMGKKEMENEAREWRMYHKPVVEESVRVRMASA
jgi:hypothetical protein